MQHITGYTFQNKNIKTKLNEIMGNYYLSPSENVIKI